MVQRAALRLTSTRRVWALLHHIGAHYSAGARVDVFALVCYSSQACASKAANQFSSCLDPASERSQVLTVRQCSVKLHSKVAARCSMAGKSPSYY